MTDAGGEIVEKRILCFGDSNTWGFDAQSGDRFPRTLRWTGRLQAALGEDVVVIEEGLNGRTAVCEDPLKEGLKGLDYFMPCLQSHKPLDLVIIMLGTNDCKARFSLNEEHMALGILRLAMKSKNSAAGPKGSDPAVLLVTPPPILPGYESTPTLMTLGAGAREKTLNLPARLEPYARMNGFSFLESGKTVAMGKADNMHLDEKGHADMARTMEEAVREILGLTKGGKTLE